MTGIVVRRSAYRILVGKYEGNRPLGWSRRRWENKSIMDLKEVGCGVRTGMLWVRIGPGDRFL
jgi:hypothetical protein